jgi:hypothetical protein
MSYQMLVNKVLSKLTLSIYFFITCFLSGYAQYNENQTQGFNIDNDTFVYQKIIESHKKNDIQQLHGILRCFQNETKKNGEAYVSQVHGILNIIQLKYIDDSVIRKDIIQLGNSTLKADVSSEWRLLNQLRICLNFLRYYEFPYYKVLVDRNDVNNLLLSDTISPILRRERVDQILFIWQKIFFDFDETWTPESYYPLREIQSYYGAVGSVVYLEIDKMTNHIKDPIQRVNARKKAEKIATEKILTPIREKEVILEKYNRQRNLRSIQSIYESYLVDYISELYSVQPYNTEEISELLKKHKMNEKFTQMVFEELKKRMAKNEN